MGGRGDSNNPKYNITPIVHEISLYKTGRIKSIIHGTKGIMIIDDRHLDHCLWNQSIQNHPCVWSVTLLISIENLINYV